MAAAVREPATPAAISSGARPTMPIQTSAMKAASGSTIAADQISAERTRRPAASPYTSANTTAPFGVIGSTPTRRASRHS